jgi:hypothetical protein
MRNYPILMAVPVKVSAFWDVISYIGNNVSE